MRQNKIRQYISDILEIMGLKSNKIRQYYLENKLTLLSDCSS